MNDGDILVSDMYLPYAAIQKILTHAGFTKKVNLHVSTSGKLQGWLWKQLTSVYDIRVHVGDNYWSDVVKAYEHGIRPEWATIHAFTPLETALKGLGFRALALLLRRFRLDNPYTPDSTSYILYDDQARYNLPVLLLLVVQLKTTMQREQLTRLLLTTRDGCLIEKLFNYLIPDYVKNVTAIRFHSSRLAYTRRQAEYERYVRETYVPHHSIIFDLNGYVISSHQKHSLATHPCNTSSHYLLSLSSSRYFISGRPLFKHLFNNTLPRVHLLSAHSHHMNDSTHYHGLSYSVVDCYYFESMNVDVVGQLLSVFFDENTVARRFMRAPLHGYPVDFARVIHKTVDAFCSFARKSEVIRALQQMENVLQQPNVDVNIGANADVGVTAGSTVSNQGSLNFGDVFRAINVHFTTNTLNLMIKTWDTSQADLQVCSCISPSMHPINILYQHILSI